LFSPPHFLVYFVQCYLQELIEEKNRGVAEASNLLSSLSLNGKKITPDEMEWKFGAGIARHLQKSEVLDSDDSSDDEPTLDDEHKDPLLLLVEGDLPRKIKGKPQESGASNDPETHVQEDLVVQLDRRSVALSDKIDHTRTKSKFAPFSSLKHEVLPESAKVPLQRRGKAKAKPEDLMPLPDNAKAKVVPLSLQESLKIQMEQAEKMKQIQLQQAAERLKKKDGSHHKLGDASLDFEGKMTYRSAEVDNDDEEAYDPDGDDEHVGRDDYE
jgi:hypothetical protein